MHQEIVITLYNRSKGPIPYQQHTFHYLCKDICDRDSQGMSVSACVRERER